MWQEEKFHLNIKMNFLPNGAVLKCNGDVSAGSEHLVTKLFKQRLDMTCSGGLGQDK